VAFADGAVKGVGIDEVRAGAPGVHSFSWFEN
jgi:hypothetical protein